MLYCYGKKRFGIQVGTVDLLLYLSKRTMCVAGNKLGLKLVLSQQRNNLNISSEYATATITIVYLPITHKANLHEFSAQFAAECIKQFY